MKRVRLGIHEHDSARGLRMVTLQDDSELTTDQSQ